MERHDILGETVRARKVNLLAGNKALFKNYFSFLFFAYFSVRHDLNYFVLTP